MVPDVQPLEDTEQTKEELITENLEGVESQVKENENSIESLVQR